MHVFARRPLSLICTLTFCIVAAVNSAHSQDSKQQLTAKKLFDSSHLMIVEIEIKQQDWDKLRAQTRSFGKALAKTPSPRPFSYFKANVVIDGVRIDEVGVRKKGFLGSLDKHRPSLKIDFGEFKKQSPIKGMDRLTLNNNKQDTALVSQYLTYKLYEDSGQPGPRCNHAKVIVNGENLGIYSNVESFKAPLLKRVFGNDHGDLYEGTVADFMPGYEQKLEKKTKHTGAKSVNELSTILAAEELDLEALGEVLDLDAFVKFWALESLVGFWDGYCQNQNNFFAYRNPKNNKFYFMPWGADSAFTNSMPIPPYFLRVKSVHSQAVIANRLYQIPEYQDKYKATLENLMNEVWDEEALFQKLDRVESKVKDHLPKRQSNFNSELTKVRDFIKRRRGVIQKELDKWPIRLTHGPRPPVYFKEIGTAQGTFDTKWLLESPQKPESNGTAELKLVLNGEEIKFKQIGVSAEPSKIPTGEPIKPPSIVFSGLRESDGKLFIVGIGTSPADFKPTKQPIYTQGILIEGKLGIFNPAGYKMLGGMLTLEAAEMKPGAAVKGSLELQIVTMAGGKAKYIPK